MPFTQASRQAIQQHPASQQGNQAALMALESKGTRPCNICIYIFNNGLFLVRCALVKLYLVAELLVTCWRLGLHTPPALAWFLAGCPVGAPSKVCVCSLLLSFCPFWSVLSSLLSTCPGVTGLCPLFWGDRQTMQTLILCAVFSIGHIVQLSLPWTGVTSRAHNVGEASVPLGIHQTGLPLSAATTTTYLYIIYICLYTIHALYISADMCPRDFLRICFSMDMC
jgi:hypothetical protein